MSRVAGEKDAEEWEMRMKIIVREDKGDRSGSDTFIVLYACSSCCSFCVRVSARQLIFEI